MVNDECNFSYHSKPVPNALQNIQQSFLLKNLSKEEQMIREQAIMRLCLPAWSFSNSFPEQEQKDYEEARKFSHDKSTASFSEDKQSSGKPESPGVSNTTKRLNMVYLDLFSNFTVSYSNALYFYFNSKKRFKCFRNFCKFN